MVKVFVLVWVSVILFGFFLFLAFLFRDQSKSSEFCYPIESGFLAYKKETNPFSMQFFLILLMFVIFDVELLFLLFSPFKDSLDQVSLILILFFVFYSLLLEWKLTKLIWF